MQNTKKFLENILQKLSTLRINSECKTHIKLLFKLKSMRQDQIKNARKTGVYMLINENFE